MLRISPRNPLIARCRQAHRHARLLNNASEKFRGAVNLVCTVTMVQHVEAESLDGMQR